MSGSAFSKSMSRISKRFEREQIISSRELEMELGHRMAIKRLVEVGWLTPVTRSYYCLASSNLSRCKIILTARLYPNAIFAENTALYIYGLEPHMPQKPEIFLEKGASASGSFLKVVKRSSKAATGCIQMKFNGAEIRIFRLERVLCSIAAKDEQRARDLLRASKKTHTLSIQNLRKFDTEFATNMAQIYLSDGPTGNKTQSSKSVDSARSAVLHAALQCYSNHGSKGLSFNLIAEMLGISVGTVKGCYPDQKALRQGVMEERTAEILSKVFDLPPRDLKSPKQYLRDLMEAAFNSIETESKELFKFQCWALAEESYVVHQTVSKACVGLIEMTRELIRQQCPELSLEEAECRATHLTSMVDHYRYIYNLYTHTINFSGGRTTFLKRFRKSFLDTFVSAAFLPGVF